MLAVMRGVQRRTINGVTARRCHPVTYKLPARQSIAPPSKSKGTTQIPVPDIDQSTLASLVTAGRASESESGLDVTISGVAAPIGGMAEFARDGIMIHGGGSNDPDPFLPYQPLCKMQGCTRVHNGDLDRLTAFVSGRMSDNIVVYTVIGSPLTLGNW